ncbi:MAG: ATPase, T2SS/T4P/T4SS family [Alphaproteobacteria bacterium]|nr:ATPase, T2SS/T4P/T4SS family [Alphaproteobacteria bacterium]
MRQTGHMLAPRIEPIGSAITRLPIAPVGERLIASKLITHDQLRIALHEQRRTGELLGNVLVRLGLINEAALTDVLASRTGLKRANLKQISIDPDLLRQFPRAAAERCRAIPLTLEDGVLEIAMMDPCNIKATDEIRCCFSEKIKLVTLIANETEIINAIDDHYGFEGSLDEILRELESEAPSKISQTSHPMIRFVNALMGDAVRNGASDVHLEPENNSIRVRYRIDGVLELARELHSSYWPAISRRVKLMGGLNIADQRSAQDGRFAMTHSGRNIDFRIAIMPTVCGENIVIRILDQRQALMPISSLGFSTEAVDNLTRIIERPQGITLVTGPTGSGKTTTLYSILNKLNSPEVNIATLEDPVEYQLGFIRQTAVSKEHGLDFASGVKAVLRQDPDIIFIGEIRDRETAQMALRSAMTGHQVYATLHCNEVWGAIPRLIDLGINPSVLAGHLSGIISQRLVRRLCPHCKIECPASPEEAKILRVDNPSISIPVGCNHCNNTGRKGRIVVAEALCITPEIDDMLMSGSGRIELIRQAIKQNFQSMQTDGINKVLSGTICLADLRKAVDMTRGA